MTTGTEGDTLEVTADITNVDSSQKTKTVELEISDGVGVVDSTSLTVAADTTVSEVLQWVTGSGDAGSYTATVKSPEAQDSTSVTVSSNSLSWDTATDWDNAVSESGVVHETVGDYAGDNTIQLGHPTTDESGSALDWYFPHNENSGSTLVDAAGTNDGTISGNATLGQTGLWGTTAHDFNSDGENIYPGTYGLGGSNAWSFSIWVNFDSFPSSGEYHVIWHPRQEYDNILSLENDKYNDEIVFNTYDGGFNYLPSGVSPSTGTWYNIVIVYDTSEYRIHVNGSQENAASLPDPDATSDENSFMGRTISGSFRDGVDGRSSHARQYDRALSQTQANGLYKNTTTGGQITTATKSFSSAVSPDLSGLSYSLNGETIDVNVIGSPGTASEETVTQSLGGASSYSLSWSNSHTDFRIKAKLSTSDVTTSPTLSSVSLA